MRRACPSMLSISTSAASRVQPPRSAFDHDAVLGLHAIEDPGNAAEQRRHRQHAQHVPGRRGVDDDAVVAAGGAEVGELAAARRSRRCPGSDSRSSRATSSRSSHVPRSAISSSSSRRAAIHRSSAAGASTSTAWRWLMPLTATRRGAERLAQGVAERRRRVGGDDQRAAAGAGGADTQGRGARRLADAALAADEPECGNR